MLDRGVSGSQLINQPSLVKSRYTFQMGPRCEKTRLRKFANNKGADQPAQSRSLISAFVIRFLESTILKLATSEISFFKLVSVADETGLSLALSETPNTGFLETRPKYFPKSAVAQLVGR